MSQIYEKEPELIKSLYNKMKEQAAPITPLLYNYFLWSAVLSNDFDQLFALLIETTTLNVPVDTNTFVKLISSMYFEQIVPNNRNEIIMYLYILL